MIITQKSGNIYSTPAIGYTIDVVGIEWHETNKRILHKQTKSGLAIVLKFLNESPDLKDGDILWQQDNTIIAVEINPCECIIITPRSMQEASGICYEIGNRHLPLFYEDNLLLIPFEAPLYNWLNAFGYQVTIESRKLKNAFRSTILPQLQFSPTYSITSKVPINKIS